MTVYRIVRVLRCFTGPVATVVLLYGVATQSSPWQRIECALAAIIVVVSEVGFYRRGWQRWP